MMEEKTEGQRKQMLEPVEIKSSSSLVTPQLGSSASRHADLGLCPKPSPASNDSCHSGQQGDLNKTDERHICNHTFNHVFIYSTNIG